MNFWIRSCSGNFGSVYNILLIERFYEKVHHIWVFCIQWNNADYLYQSLSFYFHIQMRSIKPNKRVLGRHSACISFFSITFFHNWTSYKLKLSGIFKNLIGIVILVITFCDAVISHVITSFLLFQLHCWYQEVFKRCCHTQNLEEIEEHYLPLVNKPVCDIQNMFSRNNNDVLKKNWLQENTNQQKQKGHPLWG